MDNIIDKKFPGLVIPSEQRENFENFLTLKGIERYSALYKALTDVAGEPITYEILSQHYRYDVKLRRALHKIIAFTEISMRALISNTYPDTVISGEAWNTELSRLYGRPLGLRDVRNKIKDYFNNRGGKPATLFDLLESCDMQVLNVLFLALDEDKKKQLFGGDLEHLKSNLNAMRRLRNAVEHHRILIIGSWEEVFVNGEQGSTLLDNVKNVIALSPSKAKYNLKRTVNDCLIIDEKAPISKENMYRLYEPFKIYFEEVENEQR